MRVLACTQQPLCAHTFSSVSISASMHRYMPALCTARIRTYRIKVPGFVHFLFSVGEKRLRTRPIKRDARSISLLYRDRHAHSSPLCASYIPTRKGMEEEWGKANGSVNNYPSIVHARLINSPFLLCLNFTPLILAIANSRITRISPTILPTFRSDRE